jgi:hypothetical protein
MRLFTLALLTATSCAASHGRGSRAADPEVHEQPNVESARELDREGVRAFAEGRYADAIRYFRTAFHLGGPASELWNIARSEERLDDGEAAVAAIDEYLALRGLSPQDRAEAERELQGLRARPSTLTVTTTPPGAVVTLDGRQTVGPTPLSVDVPAGAHTIAIRRDGFVPQSRPLEARYGRAVIVSLDLERAAK